MDGASIFEVTLPQDVIDFVKTKVSTGEYASESEVIRRGIAALQQQDAGFDEWARNVAVPAYERLSADPSLGIPLERVKANFEARFRSAEAQAE